MTLDAERDWGPLDLGAGAIVWSIKRRRGYLRGTTCRIFSANQALENLFKTAKATRVFKNGCSFSRRIRIRCISAKVPRTATPICRHGFCYRSQMKTARVGVYVIRSQGNMLSDPIIHGVGSGGLGPPDQGETLQGTPCTRRFTGFWSALARN